MRKEKKQSLKKPIVVNHDSLWPSSPASANLLAGVPSVEGAADGSGDCVSVAARGGVGNADLGGGEAACDGEAELYINFSICSLVSTDRTGSGGEGAKITALICFPKVNFFSSCSCGLICSTSVSRSEPLSSVRSFSFKPVSHMNKAKAGGVGSHTNHIVAELITHQQVQRRIPIATRHRHHSDDFSLLLRASKCNALLHHVGRKFVPRAGQKESSGGAIGEHTLKSAAVGQSPS